MTQTFRSRDEQVIALADIFQEDAWMRFPAEKHARDEIEEAEARGAAEERGKIVDGAAYYIDHRAGSASPPYAVRSLEQCAFPEKAEPVYSCPANVPALEARVRELEDCNTALQRKLELSHDPISGDRYERRDGFFEIDLKSSLADVSEGSQRGDLIQVTSWRKLGSVYILNASSPDVEGYVAFSDKGKAETARAALKREGGV